MEGDFTRGGEHTVQCTDDVLWKCAPETCTILLSSVTPNIFEKEGQSIDPETCLEFFLSPTSSQKELNL